MLQVTRIYQRCEVYWNIVLPCILYHLRRRFGLSRLSTAEEVAQEIEDCWDATEELSRDNKNHAGFTAPVGKGL